MTRHIGRIKTTHLFASESTPALRIAIRREQTGTRRQARSSARLERVTKYPSHLGSRESQGVSSCSEGSIIYTLMSVALAMAAKLSTPMGCLKENVMPRATPVAISHRDLLLDDSRYFMNQRTASNPKQAENQPLYGTLRVIFPQSIAINDIAKANGLGISLSEIRYKVNIEMTVNIARVSLAE